MNWMDDAALLALKSDTVSKLAYNTALIESSLVAPGLLQFFCVCYNKILNDHSKTELDNFFSNDSFLKQYYKKYKMVTILCKHEPLDPMIFINQHKSIVDNLFNSLGIPLNTTSNINDLTIYLNDNIVKLIELIKNKKEQIGTMLASFKFKGGKSKRRKFSRVNRKGTKNKKL